MVFERADQALAGAHDADCHRASRQPQQVRRFLIGATLSDAQIEHRAVALREFVDGRGERIHAAVDDAKRGRVFALYGMINGASPGIGTFAMGVAADQIGLPTPVAVGGAIGVGLWLIVLMRRRRLSAILEGGEPNA